MSTDMLQDLRNQLERVLAPVKESRDSIDAQLQEAEARVTELREAKRRLNRMLAVQDAPATRRNGAKPNRVPRQPPSDLGKKWRISDEKTNAVLETLKRNGPSGMDTVAKSGGFARETARKALNRLTDEGSVIITGTGRTGGKLYAVKQ